MEAELPFGSPRKLPSFFEPIFKELGKKIIKLKKNCFLVLRVLKERTNVFLTIANETKEWVIKSILFIKTRIKELSKKNPILLFGLREVYESSETKKEKDLIISNSNQMIHESSIQIRSMDWTNYSLTEKKMKDLTDRTRTIRNQIEKITKEKTKEFLTPEINISPNKKSHNAKRLESQKNIWQILKRRNTRLIRKSHYFIQFFIERIYIDILRCIINIPRINAQLFLESTKKLIDKYIYNNEANQERIDKTNKNTIHFIKSLSNIRNSNKNSQIFCDLSSLSQHMCFTNYHKPKLLTCIS